MNWNYQILQNLPDFELHLTWLDQYVHEQAYHLTSLQSHQSVTIFSKNGLAFVKLNKTQRIIFLKHTVVFQESEREQPIDQEVVKVTLFKHP